MRREEKDKIKNVVSIIILCISISVLIFIGFCIVSGNMENSNANAKGNANINTTLEDISTVSQDGLILVKEDWAESKYGDISYRYYKDSTTDIMFVDFSDKPLAQMEDPETGLPLTYEKYLEYQEQGNLIE